MSTQTRLLRVLEEREFMRLGGEEPISVDVRFIAATNQDLRQLVATGRFRRDLYYRLNVLNITLPALRERRDDIPLLVAHFVREAARENDRPGVTVSPDTMRILTEYDWPGNVRELRNLVESMVVLSPGGIIRPDDLPREVRERAERVPLPAAIPRLERADGSATAPELEFIFRTLLQLRIDIEELRRRFDEYRDTHPELLRSGYPWPLPPAAIVPATRSIEDVTVEPGPAPEPEPDDDEDGVVVYRTGMTLRDLEEAAIAAALREVKGNRRRAAQMLGMGERTLYRKIKEYEIPL